ncbi:unnamed protein product [Durusdinium trenchii]|uniref:Cleavage and polyadenylation specificity factor subunit 2 n=2 Tax=Durusdinium trenchii TaxID=1381693 RepID=A0ABP0MN91_9DINO
MDFALLPISKDSLEWQCSILKLGGLTVLLNCGWTESLDPKLLIPLIPHLQELDLIVLTHSDVRHLGALPYVLTKYPVSCPVVCTEPVCRLGELSCVACLEDREKYREPAEAYEVDDVLRIFMSRLTTLKYRETFRISVNGRVLAACPYPAGSHLGSAFWTLHCGSLSAVYLVDGTMRRGRYLDGVEVDRLRPLCRGSAQRWDVLVTAPVPSMGLPLPHGAHHKAKPSTSKAISVARTVREQCFLEETITALRKGGSVLIPADVAGWISEALLLFEAAWGQDRQLSSYPICWLSSVGDMVLDQVKTRLEYMGQEVLEAFESKIGHHPFVLKNIRIFQSLEELIASHPLNRPKVIFTSSQHLDGGDARELFFRLSSEPKTLLWLVGVAPAGTLARQLLEDFVLNYCHGKDYRLQQYLKSALPDEELRAFYEKMQEQASEPAPPPEFTVAMKAEDILSVKGEDPKVKEEGKTEVKSEVKAELKIKEERKEKKGNKETKESTLAAAKGNVLWSPLGWPSSRTAAFQEQRTESDQYGQILTEAELRLWKVQDQEGNKQSQSHAEGRIPSMVFTGIEVAKEEAAEWRESLREHFREPMHCEVREKIVKVNCKIRYLPDNTLEPADLTNLLQLASPRHVVLLPSRGNTSTGDMLKAYFEFSTQPEMNRPAPEVHILRPKDFPLQLALRSSKRKMQITNDLWPQISYMKSLDGVRVARLRGLTDVAKPELGPLDIDLEETAPPKLPRQGHCALPCLTRFSVLQWDWRVRLFYNFLHC